MPIAAAQPMTGGCPESHGPGDPACAGRPRSRSTWCRTIPGPGRRARSPTSGQSTAARRTGVGPGSRIGLQRKVPRSPRCGLPRRRAFGRRPEGLVRGALPAGADPAGMPASALDLQPAPGGAPARHRRTSGRIAVFRRRTTAFRRRLEGARCKSRTPAGAPSAPRARRSSPRRVRRRIRFPVGHVVRAGDRIGRAPAAPSGGRIEDRPWG